MTPEEMHQDGISGRPGCGSCSGLFHGQHHELHDRSLGIALPGNGTIPAAYTGLRRMLAKKAGQVVMDLVRKDIKPRDIMTLEAFENAIAVDMAIGGSTNTGPFIYRLLPMKPASTSRSTNLTKSAVRPPISAR